ncbi:hypothetical protein CIPAW_11G144000 [Carya illinoinensis]|uniref:Cytochrome P450 n=2 Tax=Carya illinoinensis TaxID=32201 RepID=A0A8T1P3S0_CARIL|nr:hypothetical protein CIPAW_11G144000 [Carya illinoinensis]
METLTTCFLFSLVCLICSQALLHLRSWLFNKRKLPPGPTGFPIIGNLLAIGDTPHESLAKLAKKHGPLMTVRLGFVTTVVASSAEMAREILQKNDQAFLGRAMPDAVAAEANFELSMVWLQGDTKWIKLRKICNSQMFTTHRLEALQGLRHQMMDTLVLKVVEASETGEAINIGRLVFGTTFSLLSNTMFSVDLIDKKSNSIQELKEHVGTILELLGKPNVSDFFPLLKPFDLQGIRRTIKVSYDRLHTLLDEVIDRRLKCRTSASPRCNDFLDVLLDHGEEHGPQEFNREDIKILLTDMFIGGTGATTTMVEWAMAELLRDPGIMAKANKNLLKQKEILRLPYLQSVLKETMRLHPTAPLLLTHRALIDVQVCGYTIPKHTPVLVNAWATARDPMYWDKPREFRPERFIAGDSAEVDFRGTNLSFIPFGSGRRICPGLALGVRMLSLLLASLIHLFDWKLPDGMASEEIDMGAKFGIARKNPLVVIPHLVVAKANG